MGIVIHAEERFQRETKVDLPALFAHITALLGDVDDQVIETIFTPRRATERLAFAARWYKGRILVVKYFPSELRGLVRSLDNDIRNGIKPQRTECIERGHLSVLFAGFFAAYGKTERAHFFHLAAKDCYEQAAHNLSDAGIIASDYKSLREESSVLIHTCAELFRSRH